MRAHPVRLTVVALLLAIAIVALVPGLVLWPAGHPATPGLVHALSTGPTAASVDSVPRLRIFTVERLQQIPKAEREAAFSEYVIAARFHEFLRETP